MAKLLVLFAGWLECDMETLLTNQMTNETNSVREWLILNRTPDCPNGNINGLVFESFNDCVNNALKMEYTDLDISIIED
jgi:hypothetical protein